MNSIPLAQVVADLAAELIERVPRAATGRPAHGEKRLSIDVPNLATSWIPRSEHS